VHDLAETKVILSSTIESLSQHFIEHVTPEDIPYILTLLQRARGRHTFLTLAGRAVEKLIETQPTPEHTGGFTDPDTQQGRQSWLRVTRS
jgi:hypothetical protein